MTTTTISTLSALGGHGYPCEKKIRVTTMTKIKTMITKTMIATTTTSAVLDPGGQGEPSEKNN